MKKSRISSSTKNYTASDNTGIGACFVDNTILKKLGITIISEELGKPLFERKCQIKWYDCIITKEQTAQIEEIEQTAEVDRQKLLDKYFPLPNDWNYKQYDPDTAARHIALYLFGETARQYYQDFPQIGSDEALKGFLDEINNKVYNWYYNRLKTIGSLDKRTFFTGVIRLVERYKMEQKKQAATA